MITELFLSGVSTLFLRATVFSTIIIATIIIQKVVSRLLVRSFSLSAQYLHVDETNYRFFRHCISAAIYVMGIGLAIYAVPSLRALSVSIFAGAGILAVVIGFASQHAFSNVVSGIFITVFRPFRVGDRITIGQDLRGVVEDITLRHTVIKNFENKRIIVPNSIISNEKIENASIGDEKICRFVELHVSYDCDLNRAMKIMEEQSLAHPLHIDGRSAEQVASGHPIVKTKVIGIAESSILLRAWVWAKDSPNAFTMGCDLLKSIKEQFDAEGIEIPYPHRTILTRSSTKYPPVVKSNRKRKSPSYL